MSLSEDYIGDGLFDHDFPHGVENDEWTTRDGRLLKLRDMTDRYIENVMRMIGEDDDFYGACSAELSRRANTEATTDDRPADTPGCTCNGYIDACKRADRLE